MCFVPPDIPRLMAGSGRGLSHLKSIRGLKLSYARKGKKDLLYWPSAMAQKSEISRLSQPTPKHNQFVGHKNRAKDRFVVSRKPVGKINVGVVRSLACEAGGHVCQRTPTAIQGEYATLNEDNHSQDHATLQAMKKSLYGQSYDAPGQQSPNRRVQELDRHQRIDLPRNMREEGIRHPEPA